MSVPDGTFDKRGDIDRCPRIFLRSNATFGENWDGYADFESYSVACGSEGTPRMFVRTCQLPELTSIYIGRSSCDSLNLIFTEPICEALLNDTENPSGQRPHLLRTLQEWCFDVLRTSAGIGHRKKAFTEGKKS